MSFNGIHLPRTIQSNMKFQFKEVFQECGKRNILLSLILWLMLLLSRKSCSWNHSLGPQRVNARFKVFFNCIRTEWVSRGREIGASRERTQFKKKKNLPLWELRAQSNWSYYMAYDQAWLQFPYRNVLNIWVSFQTNGSALLFFHSFGLILQALQLGISRGGIPIIFTVWPWDPCAETGSRMSQLVPCVRKCDI